MVAIAHPVTAHPTELRRRRWHDDPAAIYRRRRLGVLGLVLLLVALASVAGQLLAGSSVGGGEPQPVARRSVVVQPGDTVWSIASSLAPGTDPRPLVDSIVDANGGSTLVAGQRLDIVLP
jgi:hypothetical protein